MPTSADETFYTVDFEFYDILGAELGEDPNDFVTEIHFKIKTEQEEPGGVVELVGKGKLSLIHFGLAIDAGYPLHMVMDASSSILEMSEQLFSWAEDGQPFDKLEEHFTGEVFFNPDVCFVECLEVLPSHRGRGIGREVMTSIARRFYNSCGLVVVKAYPLQHELREPAVTDEWAKAMRYDELEQDLELSQYQLFNWYQKMGLRNPFDREYFIARPGELAQLSRTGVDTP